MGCEYIGLTVDRNMLLAIDLRFGIPDFAQIPPRGVTRTGMTSRSLGSAPTSSSLRALSKKGMREVASRIICLMDGELGGGADAGAETRRGGALMAHGLTHLRSAYDPQET